jgi:hypothetical protein
MNHFGFKDGWTLRGVRVYLQGPFRSVEGTAELLVELNRMLRLIERLRPKQATR